MTEVNFKAKGLMAVRAARALSVNKGYFTDAVESTRKNDPTVSAYIEKAAMAGATTADFIALAGSPIARELGEYIFAQTIPGKLMASAQQLPFGAPLVSFTGIGSDWLKEGEAIPMRKGNASSAKLKAFKLASLAAVSRELEMLAAAGTDAAIRGTITSAAVRKIDEKFLSADAEVDGLSPAGILKDAETATNFAEMFQTHVDNGNNLATSSLILPISGVFGLTDVQITQFNLLGVQLLFSQYATQTALIDASNVIINVQGTLIDISKSAVLEMSDAPTNNITDPTPAEMVSLYQTNSSAYRAITYCSWGSVGKAATVLQATT